jgi:hypothetical protein
VVAKRLGLPQPLFLGGYWWRKACGNGGNEGKCSGVLVVVAKK